jgi:hypothetical protein
MSSLYWNLVERITLLLLVRICNPYTNSSVLIKISIFDTHPLGPGKKCGKWVLKTDKWVYILVAGWHIRLSGGRSDLKGENAVTQRATKEAQSATKLQSHRDSLPVRVCNPYTNSAVLIKISIFNTHPLGPGKKCGKMVLKTAKRAYIFVAGWHIRLSGGPGNKC